MSSLSQQKMFYKTAIVIAFATSATLWIGLFAGLIKTIFPQNDSIIQRTYPTNWGNVIFGQHSNGWGTWFRYINVAHVVFGIMAFSIMTAVAFFTRKGWRNHVKYGLISTLFALIAVFVATILYSLTVAKRGFHPREYTSNSYTVYVYLGLYILVCAPMEFIVYGVATGVNRGNVDNYKKYQWIFKFFSYQTIFANASAIFVFFAMVLSFGGIQNIPCVKIDESYSFGVQSFAQQIFSLVPIYNLVFIKQCNTQKTMEGWRKIHGRNCMAYLGLLYYTIPVNIAVQVYPPLALISLLVIVAALGGYLKYYRHTKKTPAMKKIATVAMIAAYLQKKKHTIKQLLTPKRVHVSTSSTSTKQLSSSSNKKQIVLSNANITIIIYVFRLMLNFSSLDTVF